MKRLLVLVLITSALGYLSACVAYDGYGYHGRYYDRNYRGDHDRYSHYYNRSETYDRYRDYDGHYDRY
jgi:hypothetical protein